MGELLNSVVENMAGIRHNADHLEQLLRNMYEFYRKLEGFVLNEKDLLIASNTEKLTLNNLAKETCLLEIAKLEEERLHLVEKLRQQLGLNNINEYELRLRVLAEALDHFQLKKIADQLCIIHTELYQIIENIKLQNSENEIYAKSGIQSLGEAIRSIKEHFSESKMYEKKGHYSKPGRQSGNFVRKEI